MAALCESDSLGSEDDDYTDDDGYTETDVLLGYASRDIADSDDPTSHLGGHPSWIDPASPPSAGLARCKVCKDLMVLLLQLNGDLPEYFPGHERRIYVLTCRRKTCRRKDGCVRALRGVKKLASPVEGKHEQDENTNSKPLAPESQSNRTTIPNIGDRLFGVTSTTSSTSSNPFSPSTSSVTTASPFSISKPQDVASISLQSNPPSKPAAVSSQATPAISNLSQTFASVLSLNNTPTSQEPSPLSEPWPPESAFPPSYPLCYLVHGDYETLDTTPIRVSTLPCTMDLDDEGGSIGQKYEKDAYESKIDTTFQKFADRLEHNPEQVIRYEFKGQPLLYSKTDPVGQLFAPSAVPSSKVTAGQAIGSKIPRCQNCGSTRVFEVQLTPHAITELEAGDMGLEGMEWGTILVGVCEKDCAPKGMEQGEVGYLEEWIGVQWEEMTERI